jgi:hypothetical protein
VSTAASWTDRSTGLVQDQIRAAVDVRHLLRLRTTARGRGRRIVGGIAFVVITLASAIVPALTPDAGGAGEAFTLLLLMPSAMAGFLLLAVASAIASGGGRELVPRDQVVAFPISPTTDYLGALLLAPFNIAWMIQTWLLLGAGSFAGGTESAATLVPGLACWILAATACGQVVAWTVEWIRRLPGGILVVRLIGIAGLAVIVSLQLTGRLTDALDGFWTRSLFVTFLLGGPVFLVGCVATLALFVLAVVVGAVPAGLAARHLPRDEATAETGYIRSRTLGRTDLGMLIRMDRGSVWRGVPMRRGILVLAIGPGAVALAGALPWHQLAILPGLVVSGGALLFGVNAWTLEGRGILWRETLPVEPYLVFLARAWVLAWVRSAPADRTPPSSPPWSAAGSSCRCRWSRRACVGVSGRRMPSTCGRPAPPRRRPRRWSRTPHGWR